MALSLRLPLPVALCGLLSIALSVRAQSPRSKPSPSDKSNEAIQKSQAEENAAREKDARQRFAVQIVSSLADDARGFKDESLRVKVQARAADVLWDADQPRAHILFERAWDAAQTIDKEGRLQNAEARRRFLSGQGGSGFIPPPPNLRIEVLRLASIHDRALAEQFLKKMEEEDQRAAEERKATKYWDPTEPPEVVAKRLQLARQLLENGDVERALTFIEPALTHVTSEGVIFLVLLREKNVALADQMFSSLLERAANDPVADATSVCVLSSYVFTPGVIVTATRNGMLMNPWNSSPLPPPSLTPALRAKFFSAASQVLLRPVSPEELEMTSAGVVGTYFTIKRLLPLFAQSAPELADALQGRINVLAQGREDIIPEQQRNFVNAGFENKDKKETETNDIQARIEHASSTTERDSLYATAARDAVMKNNPKAREFADAIDNGELKKSVRNFVDVLMISKALEKKDTETSLKLARSGELSHLQRVWSYTEIAVLIKSTAAERASYLMSEAISEADRIEASSGESAQAWIAIAAGIGEVDSARQSDKALDMVKAINRTQDYTGEESSFSVGFQTRDIVAKLAIPAPRITLSTLFSRLAKEDIYRASDIASGIKNESPRAVALLTIGRSVLESKAPRSGR